MTTRIFDALLFPASLSFASEARLAVNFTCSGESCAVDPLTSDFIRWMRESGYPECAAAVYVLEVREPEALSVVRRTLQARDGGLESGQTVGLFDLIPTDPNSTYRSLSPGEAPPCQFSSTFPDWCPDGEPADWQFLQGHFRTTFGVDLQFLYERIEMNYADELGTPTLSGGFYSFPPRFGFESGFPQGSILHYAIETYQGLGVGDMSGGGFVATVSLEPFNVLGGVTFTHEWGHALGLLHSFYGTSPRVFVGLDGIMNNTYGGGTSALVDPLSPPERYVIEPEVGGFTDGESFAADYTNALTGTYQLPTCEPLDVALTGAVAEGRTFTLSLLNASTIPAGFVEVSAFDGCTDGALIETRILPEIAEQSVLPHQFTIQKTSVASGEVLWVVDAFNEIAELDESNNTICTDFPDVDRDQQKCINALNKNFAKVAKAQGKDICDCIKDFAKGKSLSPASTLEGCLAADRKGKVAKAKAKTGADSAKNCGVSFPDFGATGANTVNNVAMQKEIDLIHDIFGSDLGSVIVTKANAKETSKCQQAVAKTVKKCQDAKLKEFNKCKKNGLKVQNILSFVDLQECMGADPKQKIAKACDPVSGKIRSSIDKKCGPPVDTSTAFPGCGTGDAATLAACLDQIVECNVCLALNEADNLARDCDDFDDGQLNGSCP